MAKQILLVTTMSEDAYEKLNSIGFLSSDRSKAEQMNKFFECLSIPHSEKFASCAAYFDEVPSGTITVAYGFRNGFHIGEVAFRVYLKERVMDRIRIGTIGDTVDEAMKWMRRNSKNKKTAKRPDFLMTFENSAEVRSEMEKLEHYPNSFFSRSYIELRIDGGLTKDDVGRVEQLGTKLA